MSGHLREIGEPADVLQHREEVRRLNLIYDAWVASAEAQSIDSAEIALPLYPTPPAPEVTFARMLSDNAEGPGPEGDEDGE